MYFIYIALLIICAFVSLFFLTRSLITLLSFFSKSPFVPSDKKLFEKGIELLKIDEGDNFLDIGCGDGRVVFFCAKNYVNASSYSGIERIGVLYLVAKFKRIFFKEKSKVDFLKKDATRFSYGKYNKVFMYLLPEFVAELMPVLEKELGRNSIVVSIAFEIPEKYKRNGNLDIHEVKLGRKTKKIYVWEKIND